MSSSMAFSLSTCHDANLNSHIHRPHRNQVRSEAALSCIKISRHPQKDSSQHLEQIINEKKNACLFKRREAIKLGICFGVVEALFDQIQPTWAVEEEASSCELTVAPSGLAFCDKVVGHGAEAVKGQLIKAHYVGKLENGKVFDSSYNRGKPLSFRVGVGEVIKGWDQGILGGDGVPPMLAGGKRILKLPPELGYGKRGAGCKGGSCIIPPDATLLFDVEFIGKS